MLCMFHLSPNGIISGWKKCPMMAMEGWRQVLLWKPDPGFVMVGGASWGVRGLYRGARGGLEVCIENTSTLKKVFKKGL